MLQPRRFLEIDLAPIAINRIWILDDHCVQPSTPASLKKGNPRNSTSPCQMKDEIAAIAWRFPCKLQPPWTPWSTWARRGLKFYATVGRN